MHNHLGNPATPVGTYDFGDLDLAIWNQDGQEWELQNTTITDLNDGQNRLAAKRRARADRTPARHIRLVHVRATLRVTDMEDDYTI